MSRRKPKDQPAAPVGRPSDYTIQLGQEFCARLAEGRSMRSVCNDEDMPDKATICRWLARHEKFRDQYAACGEMRAAVIFEESLDIADDGRNDVRIVGDKEVVDYDHIQRSKLRVDTRKWFLSKLYPKKYGDKITQEVTGADGAPLVPVLNMTVLAPEKK